MRAEGLPHLKVKVRGSPPPVSASHGAQEERAEGHAQMWDRLPVSGSSSSSSSSSSGGGGPILAKLNLPSHAVVESAVHDVNEGKEPCSGVNWDGRWRHREVARAVEAHEQVPGAIVHNGGQQRVETAREGAREPDRERRLVQPVLKHVPMDYSQWRRDEEAAAALRFRRVVVVVVVAQRVRTTGTLRPLNLLRVPEGGRASSASPGERAGASQEHECEGDCDCGSSAEEGEAVGGSYHPSSSSSRLAIVG